MSQFISVRWIKKCGQKSSIITSQVVCRHALKLQFACHLWKFVMPYVSHSPALPLVVSVFHTNPPVMHSVVRTSFHALHMHGLAHKKKTRALQSGTPKIPTGCINAVTWMQAFLHVCKEWVETCLPDQEFEKKKVSLQCVLVSYLYCYNLLYHRGRDWGR